ncbi:MAG TPA: FixH family protein [Ktedonobacteraceae bacterium]
MRRRQLLILVLGLGSLIAITFVGTSIESIVAFLHPTNAIQQAQAGPYQITLQVIPNPPATTGPTNLMLQIVHSATQQLFTNAHVSVESDMESMDMDTGRINASQQSAGTYLARVQFAMSGIWQVKVVITIPGKPTESATFEIAAQ